MLKVYLPTVQKQNCASISELGGNVVCLTPKIFIQVYFALG